MFPESVQYSLRALGRAYDGNECIEVGDVYKVARQYKETWILFLESTFSLVLCTFHQFNWHFNENNKFSWNIYLYVLSTQFHEVEYKLAKWYYFKYFHLEIRKKVWFLVIISYVVYCIAYDYYFMALGLASNTEQGYAPRINCQETNQTWHVSSCVVRDIYLCTAFA
jgi:hypothetical protein